MSKKFALLFFLTVTLFFTTASLRYDQQGNIDAIRKRFWILKTHGPEKYNLIIYGDSRVYRGVSPLEFEKAIPNTHAINFGYSSASFSSFMLGEVEKKLEPKSHPKIIVLGVTPNAISIGARVDGHYREELARKKEEILEYLYLKKIEDKIAPFNIIAKKTDPKTKKAYEYIEEYFDNGWVASTQIPSDPERALETYTNNFKTNRVATGMIDTLFTQIAEWKKQNIYVFGFRPPTTEKMEKIEEQSGFDHDDFVRGFEQAGGIWIQLPSSPYKTYDGSHLEKESAIQYSKALAKEIARTIKKRSAG